MVVKCYQKNKNQSAAVQNLGNSKTYVNSIIKPFELYETVETCDKGWQRA